MKQKRSAVDGAVFLVPITNGGFGIGVLIRSDGKGRAYGAFFGPRVSNASEVDISKLRDEDAILRCRFGDHGLHTRRWPLIGSIRDWGSNPWGLPRFARHHDNPALRYVTAYDSGLNVIEESLQPVDETSNLPEDEQLGSGVVEGKLAKLLVYRPAG
jgi:hypothetical protein